MLPSTTALSSTAVNKQFKLQTNSILLSVFLMKGTQINSMTNTVKETCKIADTDHRSVAEMEVVEVPCPQESHCELDN
jgi:hypothetical protein